MIKKMTPAFTLMVMLVALLMVALLTGCSTESAEKETTPAKQKEVTKTEEKAEEPAKEEEVKDDDGYEYGDKTQHVAKEFNQEIKIGFMNMNIKSAELITLENLTEEASINFSQYGYVDGKPFNVMQISYDITNTSDKNVNFTFPIYTVVLSNGEQIDASMNNMNILESGGGEYYANSNQKELNIIVPFKSDPKEVTGFRIITDNVHDLEFNTLAEPVEAEFKF